MRLFLFFGSIALSVVLVLTSLTDVRAESQDASLGAESGIETMIAEQLKAFRERDAARAFSVMSEDSKAQYRDPSHFMTMMRYTHQPLTAHLSYAFAQKIQVGDALIQYVDMTNKDGSVVTVMVRLVKSADAHWTIDGYTILEASDAQPI